MKTRTALVKIILLLIILYILQGVIIGFIFALPLYLDTSGAKWNEQGTFNFVSYPFSLKLAWAPIVDAIYIPCFWSKKNLGCINTILIRNSTLSTIILFNNVN